MASRARTTATVQAILTAAAILSAGCGPSGRDTGGGGTGRPGPTRPTSTCGDGAVTGLEACDGSEIPGGVLCSAWGLGAGTVSCNSQCRPSFDACDVQDLCAAAGFYADGACQACDLLGGVPDGECQTVCGADGTCGDVFDPLTGKWTCQHAGLTDPDCGECGNEQLEGNELCDGSSAFMAGKETCTDYGFTGGELRCNSSCTPDFSRCTRTATTGAVCGNGVREGDEACDGADLGDATCVSLGFTGGNLTCTSSAAAVCAFDVSGCTRTSTGTPACGDGVREAPEQCDGPDLGGATCESLGFAGGGNLTCTSTATCLFDTSGCLPGGPTCGDGAIEAPEQCDGANLGGATCVSLGLGFSGGNLACAPASCVFDTAGCTTTTTTTWSWRRQIAIVGSATDLGDFQVEVVLDTAALIAAGKMRSDCKDARFKDAGGATDLTYFLAGGCNTAATRWLVRVPLIPATGTVITMIYGNPGASDAGDPAATLEWFDDFSSDSTSRYGLTGLDWYTGLYDDREGTVAWDAANEQLVVSTGDDAIALLSLTGLSLVDVAVDVKLRCTRAYPDSKLLLTLVRAQDATRWYGGNATLETSTVDRTGVEKKTGGTTVTSVTRSAAKYPVDTWIAMTTAVAGTSVTVTVQGDTYASTLADIGAAGRVLIGATQCDLRIDDLHVRKHADPAPVAAPGAEQPN